MKVTKTIDDTRIIKALYMGEHSIVREVGGQIVAYEENGEMARVVWFAVWQKRDAPGPSARVNSKYVQIVEYDS
jgi:hypothetical protein